MTRLYLDATTLIGLGTIGELDLLTAFDGDLVVLPAVREEVTTEPAGTNLKRFLDAEPVHADHPGDAARDRQAMALLDEPSANGDVRLVAAVLEHTADDEPVGVVSDDRRVRTVARGLGANVTGTIGVVVRAVVEGLPAEDGTTIVRRLDDHGLHMTAELRETAYELVEHTAETER